ncbi:hypothetical protein JCM11641_003854 [Rhodosporidiobolus odoratus]
MSSSSSSSPSSLRPVPIARFGLPIPVYIHDFTGVLTLLPVNSTISDPFTVERWNKEREVEDAYAVMYAAAKHDGLGDFIKASWYKRTQHRVRKLAEQVKKPKEYPSHLGPRASDPSRCSPSPPIGFRLVEPYPHRSRRPTTVGVDTSPPKYPRPKLLPAPSAAVVGQADHSRPSLSFSQSSLSAVFSTSSSSTTLTASSSVSPIDADKVGLAV